MAIYTKKGDRGETSLYDQDLSQKRKVAKDTARIRAIGSVDELNSALGVASSFSKDKDFKGLIGGIQRDLFTVGAILAGGKLSFSRAKVKKLERVIDKLEGKLPPLKNFILPGGSKLAAQLQLDRAVARRAEREIVALKREEDVKPQILEYFNRLSDFLFMLSREANYKEGIKEQAWKGKNK